MGNRGENESWGVQKILIKCCRKMKKILRKTTSHHPHDANKVSSIDQPQPQPKPSLSTGATSTQPCPVHCDDLFVSVKKGDKKMDADSFIGYQIQAQTHFSLRPNIYL